MSFLSPLGSPIRGSAYRNRTANRARGRALSGQFVPQQLGHTALYDVNLGGSQSQVTDSSGRGRDALVNGSSTAAALYLAYPSGALYLPSASGNLVSCPDAAWLDFLDDFEIVARVQCFAFATGSEQAILGQFPAAPNRTFAFRLSATTKQVRLYVSGNGTTLSSLITTDALPYGDGDTFWVRATRRASDGRVQIFHAVDATATPSSWTQLAPDLTGVTGSLFNSAADVEIGASAGGSVFNGKILYVRASDALTGGAVFLEYNPALSSQTGYTDSYGNVYTTARGTSGRKAVVQSAPSGTSRSVFLLGTDDYLTGPTAGLPSAANSADASFWAAMRLHATQVSGDVLLTTRSGTGAGVTLRLASATTIVADVSDGTTTNTTGAVAFTPGKMVVAGVFLASSGTAYVRVNDAAAGSTASRPSGSQSGSAFVVGATSTPSAHIDAELVAVGTNDRVLSDAEFAALSAYYGGGL
jgi:hypothetical protein